MVLAIGGAIVVGIVVSSSNPSTDPSVTTAPPRISVAAFERPALGPTCEDLVSQFADAMQQWIDFMATFPTAEQQAWVDGAETDDYLPAGSETFWNATSDWFEDADALVQRLDCDPFLLLGAIGRLTGQGPVYDYLTTIDS